MMKKILVSLSAVFVLLIVFAVFSCEKAIIPDDNTTGDAKGNLRVSVFEIEKTPFASLTRASEAASAVAMIGFLLTYVLLIRMIRMTFFR